VAGVGVGVGVGVCPVPPPPDGPGVGVPLAAAVTAGCVVPAAAACPVCARPPGAPPRAGLERTTSSAPSNAMTRTLETMATPASTSCERDEERAGGDPLPSGRVGWPDWVGWSGNCGG
jgi:hypothetical protein